MAKSNLPHGHMWARIVLGSMLLLAGVMLATTAIATPRTRSPGCAEEPDTKSVAESGAGITAVGAFGAVPGWTNASGQFGAASYAFPNGWFSARSKGSPAPGKNYFSVGRRRKPSRPRPRSARRRSSFPQPRPAAR